MNGIVSVAPEATSHLHLSGASWAARGGDVAPRVVEIQGDSRGQGQDCRKNDEDWKEGNVSVNRVLSCNRPICSLRFMIAVL